MTTLLEVAAIEEMVSAHPLVRSCIVVGEDRLYYGVVLLPDKVHLMKKLYEENPHTTYRLDTYQGLNHIEIRGYYCDILEAVNRSLEEKRIERFALLDWTVGQTREEICKDHRIIIDSFYQDYIPGIG